MTPERGVEPSIQVSFKQVEWDFVDRPAARQRQREIQFVAHRAEDITDAVLAVDNEPHTIGRPIWTARAPLAIAFTTSAPPRMPPSRMILGVVSGCLGEVADHEIRVGDRKGGKVEIAR